MSVSFGSISEAHRYYLSVRCVPISEPQEAVFSVSFGEISWLGRGKSDFAAAISNKFAKADPQILCASG